MSTVFVIADLHLGHKKLAEVRGFASVEAHDEAIVAAWNKTVRVKDVVYVLGDVFRTDHIYRLKGVKKLAMGNHDKKPAEHYARLFSKVSSYYEFDGCLLSHIPVHPCQFGRYELNIHGHMHTHHLDDLRYVNTSIENLPDMAPSPLKQLITERRKARENNLTTACSGCGNPVDLGVCWCGTVEDDHTVTDNHSFIPCGCDCFREK